MFYERLRKFRKSGESDAAFARRLGVSRAVFLNWKTGRNKANNKMFMRIMDVLDVTPGEFWSGCPTCPYNPERG